MQGNEIELLPAALFHLSTATSVVMIVKMFKHSHTPLTTNLPHKWLFLAISSHPSVLPIDSPRLLTAEVARDQGRSHLQEPRSSEEAEALGGGQQWVDILRRRRRRKNV